jgi:glutamyl-tRNA reductase
MLTPEILMEALSAHYDRLRALEVDRARKMLAAGQPAHVAMEALSRRLTRKLLHDPLSALSAAGDERDQLAGALMRIYSLEGRSAS